LYSSIYGAGRYKLKEEGSHLVLWEAGLVIKFPPGSMILIPSAILMHLNIPIPKGSTHYSITQYTTRGLFRWVDHGEKTQWMEGCVAMGLGLFSTKEELLA